MAKTGFSSEDLGKLGLVIGKDGKYYKPKHISTENHYSAGNLAGQTTFVKMVPTKMRRIRLILMGDPMPKQSVRVTKEGHFYQPAKMKKKVEDYIKQVKNQLPKDFVMFTKRVHVRKLHFLFRPIKSLKKWEMDIIKDGKILYHTKRPDMIDNLKKLLFDSMSELVYKDDGLVCSEDNVKKYYSTGGAIIIELEGY